MSLRCFHCFTNDALALIQHWVWKSSASSCCAVARCHLRSSSLKQRHVKWRTRVSYNLFPMTQMKSWEQPGCWQGSAHVLEVPPSTSTHNCDLCKHHSLWMNGLCTPSRLQNTNACYLNRQVIQSTVTINQESLRWNNVKMM